MPVKRGDVMGVMEEYGGEERMWVIEERVNRGKRGVVCLGMIGGVWCG